MRGIGDGITRLRTAIADLRPCAVPQVLERHRARIEALVRRDGQRNRRAGFGDRTAYEGRIAGLGADIHARVRYVSYQGKAVSLTLTYSQAPTRSSHARIGRTADDPRRWHRY